MVNILMLYLFNVPVFFSQDSVPLQTSKSTGVCVTDFERTYKFGLIFQYTSSSCTTMSLFDNAPYCALSLKRKRPCASDVPNPLYWNREDKYELKDTIVSIIRTNLKKDTLFDLSQVKTFIDGGIEGSQIEHLIQHPDFLSLFPDSNQIEYIQLNNNSFVSPFIGKFKKLKELTIDTETTFEFVVDNFTKKYYETRPFQSYSIPNTIEQCTSLQQLSIFSFFDKLPALNGLNNLSVLHCTAKMIDSVTFTPVEPIIDLDDTLAISNHFDAIFYYSYQELALPESWAELTNLQKLSVGNFIHHIPISYQKLKLLKEVSLFSKEHLFPSVIFAWKNLERLTLYLPNVSKIRNDFSTLSSLKYIDLYINTPFFPNALLENQSIKSLGLCVPKVKTIQIDGTNKGDKLEGLSILSPSEIKKIVIKNVRNLGINISAKIKNYNINIDVHKCDFSGFGSFNDYDLNIQLFIIHNPVRKKRLLSLGKKLEKYFKKIKEQFPNNKMFIEINISNYYSLPDKTQKELDQIFSLFSNIVFDVKIHDLREY